MNELDQLRSRLDLLDLAREYVRGLKRSGKSWMGLCPFHEERTPSFHVSPEKGLFHCFGCQASGDAIAFFMKAENLPFREAVELLCERTGLPKPRRFSGGGEAESRLREGVRKALDTAVKLYSEYLWLREDPLAEAARNYLLNRRRIDRKVIQQYKIGLAPRGSAWLLSRMASRYGIEAKVLEKAGLVTLNSRDGRYMDFFRGRLLFPVYDLAGRAAGFGGRIVGDEAGESKYLNSVDSPYFRKSDTLYGLNEHKTSIRAADKVYLVEGYFDVVGMAQAGVPLAASPMGGSLTSGHARQLRRFTERAVLLFDPDHAGINGAIRAARLLVAADMRVTVLKIPSAMDPDEYLLAYGKAAFEVLEQREAKSFIDFELEHRILLMGERGRDLESRLKVAREMLVSLACVPSEVERREYTLKTAQILRLDSLGLERELSKFMESGSKRPATARSASRPGAVGPAYLTLDEAILAEALEDRAKVRRALESAGISAEDFQNPKIAGYIFNGHSETPQTEYDLEWQELVSRAAMAGGGAFGGAQDHLDAYVEEMRRRKYVMELKRLKAAMEAARQDGHVCEPAILSRYFEIQRELKRR